MQGKLLSHDKRETLLSDGLIVALANLGERLIPGMLDPTQARLSLAHKKLCRNAKQRPEALF
ncbi:hypothetical protein AU374_01594 [Cupriavidus metallidurans]|jgi:hypothetical protein|nr:hypothetical protein AU374_01594 [Cupriavidus metallidurans]